MSRTNHYRICNECTTLELCEFHRICYYDYAHKPAREVLGRRNWTRKTRYPDFGYKRYHNPPPRWWWHEQHARVRQIHRQIMLREEDPVLPDEKDLINLWSWY